MKQNTFSFKLDAGQQKRLISILQQGNYRPTEVPHTIVSVEGDRCCINLYKSGKCLAQGKGAEDWVLYVLEPLVLQSVGVGYEETLNPDAFDPHIGVDESGKGDFFGPLVISAAYVDRETVRILQEMGVRDSKSISSDKKIQSMVKDIRKTLGGKITMVTIGPTAYNRLYRSMKNVNHILAWGHARAIENLLEKVPECPRAVADQFGPKRQIEKALMKKGRTIELVQRHKAESDPAVAAASILARAGFLDALRDLRKKHGIEIPKGASEAVQQAARKLVEQKGPAILLNTAKCHFKTTDQVLANLGMTREALEE